MAFGNFSGTGVVPSYAPTPVNLSAANIDHVALGVYCLKNLSFTPRSAIVAGDNSFNVNDTIASVSVDNGSVGGLTGCATGERVRIRTTDAAGALVDRAFNIWIE